MLTTTQALNVAAAIIHGPRANDYGDASESFARIALIWSGILGHDVTAAEVALCLAGLKMSRLAYSPDHADSWVDLIGYAALGAEIGTAS